MQSTLPSNSAKSSVAARQSAQSGTTGGPIGSREWHGDDVKHILSILDALGRRVAQDRRAGVELILLIEGAVAFAEQGRAAYRNIVPKETFEIVNSAFEWESNRPAGPAPDDLRALLFMDLFRRYFWLLRKIILSAPGHQPNQIHWLFVVAQILSHLMLIKPVRRRAAWDPHFLMAVSRVPKWNPEATQECAIILQTVLLENAKPYRELPFEDRDRAFEDLSNLVSEADDPDAGVYPLLQSMMAILLTYGFSPEEVEEDVTSVAPGPRSLLKEAKALGHVPDSCDRCGKEEGPEVALQKCSRCKVGRYCSKACQTEDWAIHKVRCYDARR